MNYRPESPVVNTSVSTTQKTTGIGLLIAVSESIRPHQWLKNLACVAGLIFSGRLFDPEMQLLAAIAVVSFSAMASAVYLFNDYIDRHLDRLNPRTAKRPLASGRLPVGIAAAVFVALVTLAIAIASLLGGVCVNILTGYLALSVAYSIRFKQTVIADVICIAIGFVLRVLFGVYAVQVLPSPWIVLCMFFLALFLGFGKRRAELDLLGEAPERARPVLSKYAINFLDIAFGITATLTVTTYTLYCVAPHHDPSMVITVLPVVYCVLRYAHQVLVEGRGQSPERLLYADKMLWLGILCWVVLSVGVLYGNPGWVATLRK